ncbi:MAG: glucokinase [Betaproteobacteria bacterium]|nr:glucokinase [Betaproteobacteria bacterium]
MSQRILVADIGGTNARFALACSHPAQISDVISLCCADFAGPLEAARAYLQEIELAPETIKRAAFAVATAVNGDSIKLTNSTWSFERSHLERALGLDQLQIFNDFEVLAYALPGLAASDFHLVGTALPKPGLPMVALGPGTGLGVAGVVPSRHGWIAVPGEGGHATLAAADDFEAEILKAARQEHAHVSAERLLSGIGLPVLLRAVCTVQGLASINFSPEEISALGVHNRHPQCRTAMELFFAFLGGFAGNLALSFGARGGVFIGGGIVPQLQDFMASSRFRERFESKGRFQPYLAEIATATLTAQHLALRGLAGALENTAAD